MDALRQKGKILGSVYGIPILVMVSKTALFEERVKETTGKHRHKRSSRLRDKCGRRRSHRIEAQ